MAGRAPADAPQPTPASFLRVIYNVTQKITNHLKAGVVTDEHTLSQISHKLRRAFAILAANPPSDTQSGSNAPEDAVASEGTQPHPGEDVSGNSTLVGTTPVDNVDCARQPSKVAQKSPGHPPISNSKIEHELALRDDAFDAHAHGTGEDNNAWSRDDRSGPSAGDARFGESAGIAMEDAVAPVASVASVASLTVQAPQISNSVQHDEPEAGDPSVRNYTMPRSSPPESASSMVCDADDTESIALRRSSLLASKRKRTEDADEPLPKQSRTVLARSVGGGKEFDLPATYSTLMDSPHYGDGSGVGVVVDGGASVPPTESRYLPPTPDHVTHTHRPSVSDKDAIVTHSAPPFAPSHNAGVALVADTMQRLDTDSRSGDMRHHAVVARDPDPASLATKIAPVTRPRVRTAFYASPLVPTEPSRQTEPIRGSGPPNRTTYPVHERRRDLSESRDANSPRDDAETRALRVVERISPAASLRASSWSVVLKACQTLPTVEVVPHMGSRQRVTDPSSLTFLPTPAGLAALDGMCVTLARTGHIQPDACVVINGTAWTQEYLSAFCGFARRVAVADATITRLRRFAWEFSEAQKHAVFETLAESKLDLDLLYGMRVGTLLDVILSRRDELPVLAMVTVARVICRASGCPDDGIIFVAEMKPVAAVLASRSSHPRGVFFTLDSPLVESGAGWAVALHWNDSRMCCSSLEFRQFKRACAPHGFVLDGCVYRQAKQGSTKLTSLGCALSFFMRLQADVEKPVLEFCKRLVQLTVPQLQRN
eukprot:Opistho-2@5250